IDAKLAELFLRAGNPLAATLADWPQTLELTTGRIQAQGRVEMLGDNPPNLTATLIAKVVGGIFDRTEVSGLDAELKLGLQRDRHRLEVPGLKVHHCNPWFSFGPRLVQGDYNANVQQLQHGRVDWTTPDAQVLGGSLW